MKFQDLNVNQTFKVDGDERVWTKIVAKPKSCCSPAHNAVHAGEKKKKSMQMFADDVEVTLVEE